jgi:segregation and condensation protein B
MTDEQDEMINDTAAEEEQICDDEFVEDVDDEGELTEQVEFEEGVGFDVTMESVVEAVLCGSDEPLSAERLVNIVEAGGVKQIRECIENLNKKYEEGGFSFRIEQIAGGYQMMTLSEFNYWLKKLVRVRTDTKLSPAALETLAIVAYKQPVIRADIEAIRGVASGEVIRNLMFKGLVKMVGKAEVLGRPMLYGTTKKFLDVFGLHTLKDLPTAEELKRPEQ